MWAVAMGLVGARLYHVVTDYQRFQGRWWSVVEVWEGGLGIPGGLLVGVITGVVLARRRGLDVPILLDVVAPAIPIAQAIGRLGNWINQEQFGRPSDLPARKSVVKGKSVSVRVDIGGCRIIKTRNIKAVIESNTLTQQQDQYKT